MDGRWLWRMCINCGNSFPLLIIIIIRLCEYLAPLFLPHSANDKPSSSSLYVPISRGGCGQGMCVILVASVRMIRFGDNLSTFIYIFGFSSTTWICCWKYVDKSFPASQPANHLRPSTDRHVVIPSAELLQRSTKMFELASSSSSQCGYVYSLVGALSCPSLSLWTCCHDVALQLLFIS